MTLTEFKQAMGLVDPIVEDVRNDLRQRSEVGIKKYGTTLEANSLTLKEWLQHSYEECLDQALYLKRAIQEIEKKETKWTAMNV